VVDRPRRRLRPGVLRGALGALGPLRPSPLSAPATELIATVATAAARLDRRMADHYFSPTPSVPSAPAPVELRLADMQLTLLADRGVFSSGRIDPGTVALLRESPPPPDHGNLLDLGCGYGPIACALARRAPASTVWAIDVNSRAVQLTAANAASLGLGSVIAASPGEIPESISFDGIWSNPPVRIGKAALHEMLSTWLARLAPGAVAWLVVNRNLGGDSLATWLELEGWTVRRAASKSGYRVLEVKPTAAPSGAGDPNR